MQTLKAICPYCNKEINSLYKEQLKQNLEVHKLSCKVKEKILKGGKTE